MMNVIIRNRKTVVEEFPTGNWAWISMYEPFLEPVMTPNNPSLVERLTLCFSDSEREGNGIVLFNDQHATQILEFLDRIDGKVNTIVSQCDGGISRSSAVAAALEVILRGPREDSWIFTCGKYHPNMHVYRKLLNKALDMGKIVF